MASVGLGLTIPMAFMVDYALGVVNVASIYTIGGALSILIGVLLLVNVSSPDPDTNVEGILPEDQPQIMEEEDPQSARPTATPYELQGLSKQ